MKHYFLLIIVIILTGCSVALKGVTKMNVLDTQIIRFYEQFTIKFLIPSNSKNLIPGNDVHKIIFTDADLQSKKRKLVWILNNTYIPIKGLTYSGKYTVSVSVVAVNPEVERTVVTASELDDYLMKKDSIVYKLESKYSTKTIRNITWAYRKKLKPNDLQKLITAATPLNETRYVLFSFEYLGSEEKEIQILEEVADSVLKSVSIKES